MVTGFTKFKEWFKGFEEQYVVIGGTACDLTLKGSNQQKRMDIMYSCYSIEK